jgi:hypothetical protein
LPPGTVAASTRGNFIACYASNPPSSTSAATPANLSQAATPSLSVLPFLPKTTTLCPLKGAAQSATLAYSRRIDAGNT